MAGHTEQDAHAAESNPDTGGVIGISGGTDVINPALGVVWVEPSVTAVRTSKDVGGGPCNDNSGIGKAVG